MRPRVSPSPLPEPTDSPGAAFDTSAGTAFAVGWQVGSLATHLAPADAGTGDDRLPDATALPAVDPYRRARVQIKSGLHRLTPQLESAGVQAIETQPLDDAIQAAAGDPAALSKEIEGFDGDVSSALTAADGRLGKAYNLGRALARTCLMPEDHESFDDAFGPRVVDIKNWLADLSSSFSPHASRAVSISLRTWERWAAEPKLKSWTGQSRGRSSAPRFAGRATSGGHSCPARRTARTCSTRCTTSARRTVSSSRWPGPSAASFAHWPSR